MKDLKNRKILIIAFIIVILSVGIFRLYRKTESLSGNYVSVYFVKSVGIGKEQLVSVKRQIAPGAFRLEFAVDELLKGPDQIEQQKRYFTEIPAKTVLLGVKKTDKGFIINLSKDFNTDGGSTSMTMRLKQLTYTALDASGNKPVYLYINGKKADYIGGEGVEFHQPLYR